MNGKRFYLVHAAVLCFFATTLGCQATSFDGLKKSLDLSNFDLTKRIPWATGRERRENPPERLVGFWNESVLHKSDGQLERGFGGRLYFYDRENTDSIEVDGQLVVYAFDETNRNPTDNRPTRRFVFPAEQFAQHFSESKLGASYSIWLPWDQVGGQEAKVSLIARFEPKSGPRVVSQQTEHRLPGNQIAQNQTVQDGTAHRAQLASYMTGTEADGTGAAIPPQGVRQAAAIGSPLADTFPRRMTTTSIALPRQSVPIAVVRKAHNSAADSQRSLQQAVARTATPKFGPNTIGNTAARRDPTWTEPATLPAATATPRVGFQHASHPAPIGSASPPPSFRTPSPFGQTTRPFGR